MNELADLPPDGISERHIAPARAIQRHANPASIIIAGAMLVTACLGVLGGGPHPRRSAETEAVRLDVATPATLRSGLFFESRITITPKRPLEDVVLAISPALWRDITINSAIPAAEKEGFEDGMIRMSFGPARTGEPIAIKFDGQVNPPLVGRVRGRLAVFDGDEPLASLPIAVKVLP